MRPSLLTVSLAALVTTGSMAMAQSVTVQAGDTLYSLAARQMGDPLRWPELCAANAELLGGDCSLLRAGDVLRVPGIAERERPDPVPTPAPLSEPVSAPSAEAGPDPEPVPPILSDAVPEPDPAPEPAPPGVQVLEERYDLTALSYPIFVADVLGFIVDHNLPEGPVRLAGNVPGTAPTGRPGIHMPLSQGVTRDAAGRRVVIEMQVRLTRPGRIALAYARAGGTGSGWRDFALGTTAFTGIQMVYDVPPGGAGGPDHLGILPDPLDSGQVLEIAAITVRILE